jgi:hypothetical protein
MKENCRCNAKGRKRTLGVCSAFILVIVNDYGKAPLPVVGRLDIFIRERTLFGEFHAHRAIIFGRLAMLEIFYCIMYKSEFGAFEAQSLAARGIVSALKI